MEALIVAIHCGVALAVLRAAEMATAYRLSSAQPVSDGNGQKQFHLSFAGTVGFPALLWYLGYGVLVGWLRPRSLDGYSFRQPVRDRLLVLASGPVACVVGAIGWSVAYHIFRGFGAPSGGLILVASAIGVQVNGALAVFSLLPIPRLSGGRIVRELLPESATRKWDALGRVSWIVIYILVVLRPLGALIDLSATWSARLLIGWWI